MHIRRTQELTAEVDYARRQPEPAAADHEFVSRALQRGLPQKLKDVPELERRAEAVQRKIVKLEEQYEQVIARMRREGLAVRREIVRDAHVVAATLALLRISPELHEREYDYVIVDEVAFACPPEVVYAASRAREGVTLLGDFLRTARSCRRHSSRAPKWNRRYDGGTTRTVSQSSGSVMRCRRKPITGA